MPAVSRKQQRFMAMCAHNPSHARGKCPPKSVAREFSHMKSNPKHVRPGATQHKGPMERFRKYA